MPKKPCFGTLKDGQHVKGTKRPLRSAWQYLCQIFWSLWKEISSKNSVLVGSEVLRLFFNILPPDEMYSLSVKGSVYLDNFKCTYLKIRKSFLFFFCCIYGRYIKCGILWRKRSASEAIPFWNYRLQKAGLLKYLKSPLSVHFCEVNMLRGL